MRERMHGRAGNGIAGMTDGRCQFGQTKIQDFGLAAFDKKDICRLDIAVNDSFGVRGIKAAGDLNANFQKLRDFDGLRRDAMLESLTLEEFHGDKGAAFEFADIVNGANVGMIQRRGRARFAAKSLDGLNVLRNVVRKELEGNTAAKAGVLGFVDHAHAAATEFFKDAVMRDSAPDNRDRIRHWP